MRRPLSFLALGLCQGCQGGATVVVDGLLAFSGAPDQALGGLGTPVRRLAVWDITDTD